MNGDLAAAAVGVGVASIGRSATVKRIDVVAAAAAGCAACVDDCDWDLDASGSSVRQRRADAPHADSLGRTVAAAIDVARYGSSG